MKENEQPKVKDMVRKWENLTNVDLCPLPTQKKLKFFKESSKQISTPTRNHLKGVEGSHKKIKREKKEIKTEGATEAQKIFMKKYFLTIKGGNREDKS